MTKEAEATKKEGSRHPLDPLNKAEMDQAVAIMQGSDKFGEKMRFVKIDLNEPLKEAVLNFKTGDLIDREVFMILLDNADGATYESVVSLSQEQVKSFEHIPNVQPSVIFDEFFECEDLLKENPEFQAALKKRGITDMDLVTVDPWSAGNYEGTEEEHNRRILRALTWVRGEEGDNSYARPVDGLIAIVDMNKKELIRIEDHEVIPLPPESGNYAAKYIDEFRKDVKPLDIVQPEGPGFEVDGYEIKWQKWSLRVGFTHREGLVIYTVGYEDQGRVRPVLYRGSLVEMTVPYGDTNITQCRKNAFDLGEYGVGMLTNSLQLGCDCLGEVHYFDAIVNNAAGEVVEIPNAICLHEEDSSILWKHVDFRTEEVEVRRSRRLVVSFIATVANYEYAFYWYFYQDGTIQYDVKLTGILSTAALLPGKTSKYGTLLAPQLYGPNHQHFLCVRLDMMVDGNNNTVREVHTEAEPMGPENPYGNAFYAQKTLLCNEKEGQQIIDPLSGRYWEIINTEKQNRMGEPVAYKLQPGENILPFAHPTASVSKRAGYMSKHLWVTPYERAEKFPAGDYPNQHPGHDGLPKWTQANRSIENTNVVVWYSMGHNHIPRLEDWPVMPVVNMGFTLRPSGFFDRNPALDVPPSAKHCHD